MGQYNTTELNKATHHIIIITIKADNNIYISLCMEVVTYLHFHKSVHNRLKKNAIRSMNKVDYVHN